jgi:hypothetical protein
MIQPIVAPVDYDGPVPFDKDAERDTLLSGIALTTLVSKYEQQHGGRGLTKLMKKQTDAPDAAKLAGRIDKAMKAAFADLATLVEAMPSEGSSELPPTANDALLREIYWRVRDGWRARPAPAVKMFDVSDAAPTWDDLGAMFGELAACDHQAGDGAAVPSEWYSDLLGRFEARLGKDKPKKKAAPKKPAPVIKEPPPDAQIIDYSPRATFQVGQWVRHPKFGVGHVVDAAQHVTIEIGADRKVLAHTAAQVAPIQAKLRPIKPVGDTLELARAAGIDIKKVPPRFDEEK